MSALLRPEPHAARLHPPGESARAARLRVAAEILLQMGGTTALRVELQHERARTHPDWAAELRRQIGMS